jgi:Polyketide cyclase / dehydrase and lipid transport
VAKRTIIVAVAAVIVAVAWLGSRGLSGRGFGFGDDDCELSTGRAADGVLEAEARCEWPLPAARIDALLAAWGDQSRYFSNVAESTVLEQGGERALVRQVHHASGIADREVVVECFTEALPGGHRYRWRKASDQSRASGQRVEVAVHEGFWLITDAGDKTVVEYHLRYLPGGSVPSFLVSMFMSSGMEGVLADLRRAAATTQTAARSEPGA